MLLQTSNPKLLERALQHNVSYDDLLKLGIAKEQSAKCSACSKMNYFAKACRSRRSNQQVTARRLPSAENSDSEETSGRIVNGKIYGNSITVKVNIQNYRNRHQDIKALHLAADTGVS